MPLRRDHNAITTHRLGVLERVLRLEKGAVGKLFRLEKVQERPQLLDAVLQGRARDEQLGLKVPLLQLLQQSSETYIHTELVFASISA